MKSCCCRALFLIVWLATSANCQDNGLQIGILPSDAEDSTDWIVQVVERQVISGVERLVYVNGADVLVMQGKVEKFRDKTGSYGKIKFQNLKSRDGDVTVYVKHHDSEKWERSYRPAWRLPSRRVEVAATRPLEPNWGSASEKTSFVGPPSGSYCAAYAPSSPIVYTSNFPQYQQQCVVIQ
jgi:hypothetical protein